MGGGLYGDTTELVSIWPPVSFFVLLFLPFLAFLDMSLVRQETEKLTLGHELGDSLKVHNGDDGEERYKDQEVDLRWGRCQRVDIVPVGHCLLPRQ